MARLFASQTLRRILIGLFLVLALALCELWLYAANKLGGYMHQPIYGGAPLVDYCASSEIAGFPFRLKLRCANISTPVQTAAGEIFVRAQEAQGKASIFAPNHVILSLSSPVVLQKTDGAPFAKLRHDGLRLDISWSLHGVAKAELDADAVDWRPEAPEAGIAVNLRKLKAAIEPAAEGDGLHFDIDSQGVTAPALASIVKNGDLGQVSASGKIVPTPRRAASWRASVEQWRSHSGRLTIDRLDWRAGEMEARVHGALRLNESHIPVGRLNVAAKGAGPFIARLVAPGANAGTKILLDAVLAKPAGAKGEDAAIKLPLVLARGHVFLGPFRLPVKLAPVY